MADEILFNMWTEVPAGSSLVISVEGSKADKLIITTLDGIETTPAGAIKKKLTGILNTVSGKAETFDLKSSRVYTIDVINTFVTDADAVVHAHIEDPDGEQFGEAVDTTLTRKKTKVEPVTLLVATRQGGGS